MKTWNRPEINELKLSGTELHGKNPKYVDGFIYDAERDTNWASYSGTDPDRDVTEGEVTIKP